MASLFWRSTGDTSAVAPDLEDGERVLASGRTLSGESVVATDRRLFLPERGGHRPIGWDGIEKATWNQEEESLFVVETAPAGTRPLKHRVNLDRNARLLDVVREQVTASVVISRHVPVDPRRGVRVTGRRRPGADKLSWTVTADAGLDVGDPEVRSRIGAAVDAVRAEVE